MSFSESAHYWTVTNTRDVGADKVFSTKMKTLTLKNCDVKFVDVMVGIFEDVDYLFGDLEINIVD